MRDLDRGPDAGAAGKHTLTVDTYTATEPPDGTTWDDVKEEFAWRQIDVLRRHTTNMEDDNILDYAIHTPADLYAHNRSFFNGSPTGGKRIIAQLGAFRPFPGWSQYRSPISKLYMAGPSCHPGHGIPRYRSRPRDPQDLDLSVTDDTS
jgi:phytoene dehydrogenase-like protein